MRRYTPELIEEAIHLRRSGRSYTEICDTLKVRIPKSTQYHWFLGIEPTHAGATRLKRIHSQSIKNAQEASVAARAVRRKKYFADKETQNAPLLKELSLDSVRKIILATLYMAEGTKSTKGSITFGNSDPGIISLFLSLLRETYEIDETKFRCKLQGREDQPLKELEHFWSEVTGIPLAQFYKARIDPRSLGKTSKKKEYKGVCRIDYFSADLLYELLVVGSMLKRARSSSG